MDRLMEALESEDALHFWEERRLTEAAASQRYEGHLSICPQCRSAEDTFAADTVEGNLLAHLCATGATLERAWHAAEEALEGWHRDFLAAHRGDLVLVWDETTEAMADLERHGIIRRERGPDEVYMPGFGFVSPGST